jgi:hypothetical protein
MENHGKVAGVRMGGGFEARLSGGIPMRTGVGIRANTH